MRKLYARFWESAKVECLSNYKAVLFLRKLFSSKYLPFISAAVVLICYYLGWEVVSIWYFCLCGLGIMLTCKDVTPIFSVFLLMGVMVSVKHSPNIHIDNPSDYFTRPENLVQMVIAITLLIGMAATRVVESIIYHRFKITPMFIGLAVFVAVYALNGLFSEYYTIMNLVYAMFLALLFLGIFCFASGNIKIDETTFDRIAFCFLALLAVLTIELAVAYITYDNLFVNGTIDRGRLFFGWGTYNNFGMFATMCIPAPFYLSAKYRHGWAFTLVGLLSLAVACLCMSRQAIMMGAIIFVACAVWLLIRTHGIARLNNAVIFGIIAIIGAIAMAIAYQKIADLFVSLLTSIETGSGRTIIWKEGIDNFLNYPLFGAGLYSRKHWVWGESGFANIIPVMYHNTVIQLLGSGGLFGFAAYCVHRVQTVLSFIRNITHERVFIVLLIAALLLTSLLDNHIFYLFPTIIYSMLLGVLTLSENKVAVKGAVVEKQDDLTVPAV